MNRIFIVYNPNSSRFSDVKKDVLNKLKNLKGYLIGKYEVEKTDVDKNAEKFAKILKDGDLVISAGGDATGVISVNAILKSNKDVTLAVLPYGNFNDLSRTLGTKNLEDVFGTQNSFLEGTGGVKNTTNKRFEVVCDDASRAGGRAGGSPIEPLGEMGEAARTGPARRSVRKYYPLEIYVDGKFFRFASCYVTIGMMGEAVKLYDSQKMRKKLKKEFGRKVTSYTALASWYFKNRHKKIFLPEFKLNGELQPKKVSDYCALNGRYMARVMRGRDDYKDPKIFRREAAKLTSFWRLFSLMAKSILYRVPGSETKGDKLEFLEPATVELQAEGEYKVFKNIKTIEVRKGKKCLKVITKH